MCAAVTAGISVFLVTPLASTEKEMRMALGDVSTGTCIRATFALFGATFILICVCAIPVIAQNICSVIS
jgi:hypothetical protein